MRSMMFLDYKVTANFTTERRAKPRMDCSFPAVVRGRDPLGKRFEANATLVNLSAKGLYLQLDSPVAERQQVLVVFRLAEQAPSGASIAKIAVRGSVVRTERQVDGRCGLAIKLERQRFF